MKLPIILFIFLMISSCQMNGQYAKTASCNNIEFDKKVDSYLSYSSPVISVAEASLKKSDYIFLDAREKNEYNVSHIPTAKFIGYDDFEMKNLKGVSKDSKIVVYCSIGYRSEKIATKLKKEGFKNVYNLYGSIFEWANEGQQLVDINNKPTTKIHTYNKDWSQWVKNPKISKTW